MECTVPWERVAPLTAPYDAEAGDCPVDWANRTVCAFRKELCGRSLFCREGMAEIHRLTEDIASGKGRMEDIALLGELCDGVRRMADCEAAKRIAANIDAALRGHMDVWEAHIRRKRCAALSCTKLLIFYIDATKCSGCGRCARECPAGAIEGGEGLYHIVSQEDCTRCGRCAAVCHAGAVCKAAAGAILPRLPERPGAVGSFKGGLGGVKRGLRGK